MKTVLTIITLVAALTLRPAAMAQDKPATDKPAAAEKKSPVLFEDPVIAKGKGVEIKRSELEELATGFKATAAGRGQVVQPEQMLMVERQLLDRLIQMELLLNKATPEDKAAGQKLADERLETVKKRAASEEALERQLKSLGMTIDQLKKRLIEEATAETVLERELKPKSAVTEEQAKKYYEENPDRFESPEQVRASHILIATSDPVTRQPYSEEKKAEKRKLIEDILKRAREGEDFAKLAKEYSEDPGSKDTGGEYTFGRGRMVPEFEKAAFELEPGKISNVITTDFGYHIIKLSEKLPAKKEPFTGPLTKTLMRDEGEFVTIERVLTDQQVQKEIPGYLKKMREDANVEILDDRLKMPEEPAAGNAPEKKD